MIRCARKLCSDEAPHAFNDPEARGAADGVGQDPPAFCRPLQRQAVEDFTDDARYFGSQEALMEMIEHMPGFCDLENMFSLAMSEYYFE